MDTEVAEVDAIVVGLGPGGEAVATELADAGLDVVGVEKRLVGGECPYFACIPTKMMVRAAGLLAEGRRIPGMAGHSTVNADWSQLADRIRDEGTADWDDQAAVDRLTDAGVRVVRGQGTFVGPRTIDVVGQRMAARRGVILNTGTDPAIPPIDGLADTPYWTNRDVVQLTTLPESIIVIGGGPIGLELTQVLARFGVDVTVVETADRLLATAEPEASGVLADALATDGVQVLTGTETSQVSHDGQHFTVTIGTDSLQAEALLVATGRQPNLSDLGLELLGLDPDAARLDTDDRMRVTGTEGLWAIGDITGHGAFTHVSTYQAQVAAADMIGNEVRRADYRAVPRVTFTDPEVAAVGHTEHTAREAGLDIRVGLALLPSNTRGWIHGPGNDGFVKIIEDAATREIVGATSVGPAGGEVLGALTLAVHARIPTDTIRSMIGAFPTFHRAITEAMPDGD